MNTRVLIYMYMYMSGIISFKNKFIVKVFLPFPDYFDGHSNMFFFPFRQALPILSEGGGSRVNQVKALVFDWHMQCPW